MNASGAKLIAHKDAVPWLKLGINNPAMKPTNKVVSFFMHLKKWGGPPKKNLPFNFTINDILITNDNFELFRNLGIPANIVCLPGHTSDSISIIFDDGNALIGDAAINTLSIIDLDNRPLVAENSSLIPKSWEKIKDHGGITPHVSHGKSFNINKLKFTN